MSNKKPSQAKRIAWHLKETGGITGIEALEEFDCWRLSARILELRQIGIDILTVPLKLSNGKVIALYRWVDTDRNRKLLELL